MKLLILGVAVLISGVGRAWSQEPPVTEIRESPRRLDVERAAVDFLPTRVLRPGEPFPPAEIRVRRPSISEEIERLRKSLRRLDVERAAVEFPPTRVLRPGEPFPPAEIRVRRP